MKKIKTIIAILLLPLALYFVLVVLIIVILGIISIKNSIGAIPPEEREPMAIEMASEYMEEKYGDSLMYDSVSHGVTGMLGGNPYWDVRFKNEAEVPDESFEVRVIYDKKQKNLYIEYETYYSYYIKDKMYDWFDSKLQESSLNEYTLEYVLNYNFSPEWSIDYSTEEILEHLPNNLGCIKFYIRIPERERGVYDNGRLSEELSEISPLLENALTIVLIVYSNDIYDEHYREFNRGNRREFPEIEDIYLE